MKNSLKKSMSIFLSLIMLFSAFSAVDFSAFSADSSQYKVTCSAGVKLRSNHSTSSSQLTSISSGSTFYVTEKYMSGGYYWGKTTYNGYTGWTALLKTDASEIYSQCKGYYYHNLHAWVGDSSGNSVSAPYACGVYYYFWGELTDSLFKSQKVLLTDSMPELSVNMKFSITGPASFSYNNTYNNKCKTYVAIKPGSSAGTYKCTISTSGDAGNECSVSLTVNSYTVSFNANGGSCSTSSKSVTYGSTYGTLPTPTRTGYTFDGWYTSSSGGSKITSSSSVSITSAQTLYAHWTANKYTVNFNANGGSCSTSSKSVTYGSTYGTLPTPTRTGFTFDGWYTSSSGGSQITSSSNVSITSSQTLYAQWTQYPTISINTETNVDITTAGEYKYFYFTPSKTGTYKFYSTGSYDTYGYIYDSGMNQLNYNDDGGSGSNFSVSYSLSSGTKYILGARLYSSSSTGSFNVCVEYVDTTSPIGSISSTNNCSGSQTVTLKLSDDIGVAGYYWGTNSSYSNNTYYSTSSSTITKTVSNSGTYYLTVKDTSGNLSDSYSITYYKTTLDANGGSVSQSYVITKSDNIITLPTPTRTGYTFVGWSTSSTDKSGYTGITPSGDETYYAIWSANSYTVNFNANGGSCSTSSKSVTYGSTYGTLPTPTRTGYTFDGWYTSSSGGSRITSSSTVSITTSQTLYAHWSHTHSYDCKVKKEATCTNTGEKIYTCSICGDSYTTTVTALGHSYEETVVMPTCTDMGYTIYHCARCGDEYISDYVNSLRHNYTSKITKSQTCTEEGIETFTCLNCDDTYTQPISALGHSYADTVVMPTCTDMGYTIYHCSRCGDEYISDYVDSLGHSYTSKITKSQTCTEEGIKTFTCTICGDSYTQAINPTGHSYSDDSRYCLNGCGELNPYYDINAPTGSITSTNNCATSQTVRLDMTDDSGIAGYYWGTSSNYSNNTYYSTGSSSATKTVSNSGTYYFTIKDIKGNVSSTYNVTFYKTTLNGNGGSVSPKYVITKSGNSITLPTPVKSNYDFAGWSTSSTATSGVTSITPSSNKTYYAVWKDTIAPSGSISSTNKCANYQTVTLDMSDNLGIAGYYWGKSSSYSNNRYYTTSLSSVTKTVSDSGKYYFTVEDTSGNLSDTYSITFYRTTLNANGGSVSPGYIITKSGNSVTLPAPSFGNAEYVCWQDSNSVYYSGSYTPRESKTLTAVWKELAYLYVTNRKQYYVGDSIDKELLTVEAHYMDNSVKTLSVSDYSASISDTSKKGDATISVSYTEAGKTVNYSINVNVALPSIYAQGGGESYYSTDYSYLLSSINNTVTAVTSPSNVQVYWRSSDTSVLQISRTNSKSANIFVLKPSEEPVTITAYYIYNGKEYSCSFIAEIFFIVESASISSKKTSYAYGENFSREKITAIITDKGGNKETVTVDSTESMPSTKTNPGTYTRTIAFYDKTLSYKYTVKCATPKISSVKPVSSTSQKVTWSKAGGAKGYYVYRATSKTGTYKKISTTSSTSITSSKLSANKTYYYKVKAYYNTNSTYNSAYSAIASDKTKLGTPASVKAKSGTKKVTVSWKKVSGAKGYYVYRATSKNGKYTKVATTSKTSYTNSKLKSKKTYYYKVVAYSSSSSYNSAYSKTVSAKTK